MQSNRRIYFVAPRVGAWIETSPLYIQTHMSLSHPVWVRGLKLAAALKHYEEEKVAPRVGAWIETLYPKRLCVLPIVAPRVGAWIETFILSSDNFTFFVAPRVGAWIETGRSFLKD